MKQRKRRKPGQWCSQYHEAPETVLIPQKYPTYETPSNPVCVIFNHSMVRATDLGPIGGRPAFIVSGCGLFYVCDHCGYFEEYTGSLWQLMRRKLRVEIK